MKTVCFGVAVAALFLCSNTFAADFAPPVEASPVPAAYDWTGFYAGVHAGGLWGNVSVRDDSPGVVPGPFDYTVNGGFAGITAGYNWQAAGGFVLGAEGDLGWMAPNGSGIIGSSHAASHQDLTLGSGLYGDLTGRAGFAADRALFYAKGGAAFFNGEAKQQTTNPNYVGTGTDTFFGWTAGAGIEYALTDNLTAKLEYQHFDFGVQKGFQTALAADPPTPAGFKFDNFHTLGIDTVKVGLNYKF